MSKYEAMGPVAGDAGLLIGPWEGSKTFVDLLRSGIPGPARAMGLSIMTLADAGAVACMVGGLPDRLDSPEAARALATAALLRVWAWVRRTDGPAVGVGVAPAPRWPHAGQVDLAIQTATTTTTLDLRGAWPDRGLLSSVALLREVIFGSMLQGLAAPVDRGNPWRLRGRSWISLTEVEATEAQALVFGRRSPFAREPLDDRRPEGPPRVLFPGSLNPVHASHLAMGRLAAELLGEPVHFELSLRNPDKPPLDFHALRDRREGLRYAVSGDPAFGDLWLTNAPTFPEKAALFPCVTFVVGLDTFRRIGDARYYGGTDGLDAAIVAMREQGIRFLVFFRHGDDLDGWDDPGRYPPALAAMARFVDRDRYGDEGRLASRRFRAGTGDRPD